MKNKFIMTAAIVTAMTMVTPSLASAAEIQPIASEKLRLQQRVKHRQ